MSEREDEKMRDDFRKQLEKLRAKEAIIGRGTFNAPLWRQRNPSMREMNVKRLFTAVSMARMSREEDLRGDRNS